jgi:hypothetical protein
MREPSRTVFCEDALGWLKAQGTLQGCSLITSLPDVSELGTVSLETWKSWFKNAARATLAACPDDGVCIFYQTDIKKAGTWVDKGYLVQVAAEAEGSALLWHKVVCRVPPGNTTHGRPAWAHMLCFSRGLRADLARATPDVLPSGGEMTWARAIGLEACTTLVRYVRDQAKSRTVVDPFCGVGTVLAVSNALGLDAVGVELNKKRARKAKSLTVTLPER